MSEGMTICKGGKLTQTKWVYDDVAEEGSYVTTDITDQAITKLLENCELEKGVTFRDICLLMKNDKDLFNMVLRNWSDEYVDEVLAAPVVDRSVYSSEAIEYLELYYSLQSSPDGLWGLQRPSCGGVGFELKEDQLAEYTDDNDQPVVEWAKGSRISWGISFTGVSELADLPVVLNPDMKVYNDDLDSDDWSKELASYPNVGYTLLSILDGLFWEISFHGGPTNKKDKAAELKQIADDVRSGKAKTVSGDIRDIIKKT